MGDSYMVQLFCVVGVVVTVNRLQSADCSQFTFHDKVNNAVHESVTVDCNYVIFL